jgi:hypothetical protein
MFSGRIEDFFASNDTFRFRLARHGRRTEFSQSVGRQKETSMNRKPESVVEVATFALRTALVVILTASALNAQNLITVSNRGSQDTTLAPHLAAVATVPSDLNASKEGLKNAGIDAAEGKAIGVIAAKTLPIPVVGALPVTAAMDFMRKFKKNTLKADDVTYLQGLSADPSIQSGGGTFMVPAQTLRMLGQGARPMLVRVHPSAKDSVRIVQITHVEIKTTNSAINPVSRQVLRTETDAVPCNIENLGNGDVALTPRESLPAGEYAILLIPAQQGSATWAWDFRAVQN